MNILIIPDVHGRNFWRKSCENINEFDKVIFLGDYLDPYPGEATKEQAIEEFKAILDFYDNNTDKVVLLLGNHDLPYFSPEYGKALSYWCRHDTDNSSLISELFDSHEDKFKIAWDIEENDKRILFTHAGINSQFKDICGITAEQINKFFLEEANANIPNIVGLACVSYYRGGNYKYGSPVWADIHEHLEEPVKEVFQIFGHTYSRKPIITNYFDMLDVGSSCFILKDGVLYWESGLIVNND